MTTKKEFLAVLRREMSKYKWAQDTVKLDTMMSKAAQTLNGEPLCNIDGPAWLTAWKEVGMPGKPNYKALSNLTD